jgi:hypothetical protein
MSHETTNVIVTRSGTGWTVDVTVANLSSDTSIKDFLIFHNGTITTNANYTKTTPTLLTYSGSALGSGTVVEVHRYTDDGQINPVGYGDRLSSSDYNNELERVHRILSESRLNGLGGLGSISVTLDNAAYDFPTWSIDTVRGATRQALANKIVGLEATDALKAPLASPTLTGTPTTTTAALGDSSGRIASTGWAQGEFLNKTGGTVTGAVAFQGNTTAISPSPNDNSTKVATTAYCDTHFVDVADTQTITGTKTFSQPVTITAPSGGLEVGDSTSAGGTPYVDFHYGVGSPQDFNVRFINDTNRQLSVVGAGGLSTFRTENLTTNNQAFFNGGTLDLGNGTSNFLQWSVNGLGAPTFTTRSAGTKAVLYPSVSASSADYAIGIETNAMWFSVYQAANAFKWYGGTTELMNLTGTTLTVNGNLFAATPAVDTNSTRVATTAYYVGQASSTSPVMNGTATVGTSLRWSRADHVHPSDTSRAADSAVVHLAGSETITGFKNLSGGGQTITPAVDNNTQNLATTAFVLGQASVVSPSMDGTATTGTSLRYARADHVHPSDTSRAPLASPAFTGTPTAPTPAVDNNSTSVATTAYYVGQASAVIGSNSSQNAAVGTSLRWARADHAHPDPRNTMASATMSTTTVNLNAIFPLVEFTDVGANYATTRYTAPITGVYLITAEVFATASCGIRLVINGGTNSLDRNLTASVWTTVCWYQQLTAGDFVELSTNTTANYTVQQIEYMRIP